MDPKIRIKGIREGLLVSLGEGEWPDLHDTLLEHIDQKIDFLKGGKIFLDVGNHILHAVELSRLRDAISDRSLVLWGVLSNSPTTEQTAQLLGLATRLSRPSQQTQFRDTTATTTSLRNGDEAILIKKTLRSGFSLENPSSIVIVGDVNPGAKIIAGANIIVWGNLRGIVHAGADGDVDSCVYALNLSPSVLRIAEVIATPRPNRSKSLPEFAKLLDGKVIVEPWKTGSH